MFEIMSIEMFELYILYKKQFNLYNVFNSLNFQKSHIGYTVIYLISDNNGRTLKELWKNCLNIFSD